MNLKTCLSHFPSLTTSFKILQLDKTKKKKKWGRRNLLEVKEGEEVHELASGRWEEVAAWLTCNDRWNFFSKIHKSLNYFFDFYSSSKTFNFLEIRYPKFGIRSDIAEMTPVRPVFKPERNTSIPVLAKVPERYTWGQGRSHKFLFGGPICVANLLVYTNFYIHTQTHVSIHTHKKLVSFIMNL